MPAFSFVPVETKESRTCAMCGYYVYVASKEEECRLHRKLSYVWNNWITSHVWSRSLWGRGSCEVSGWNQFLWRRSCQGRIKEFLLAPLANFDRPKGAAGGGGVRFLLGGPGYTNRAEVEFTNFLGSRVYLGFLKSWLESRFQEVAIHQFGVKNATWVAFLTWTMFFNNTD